MKLSPLAPLVPWIAVSALAVSSPSLAKPAPNSRQPQSSDGSPVACFEMDTNVADDDFKKITSQVVAELNALLGANPMMATH